MSRAERVLTPAQDRLLTAALAEAGPAREAWHEWERLTDWEHKQVDAGSHRLLALVYRNMVRVYPENPALARLKGVYRKAWFENRRLWGLAVPAFRVLAAEGIPVMLVKGASLSLRYYRDHGARAMDDVDMLVPEDRAIHAATILEKDGWRSIERAPAPVVLRFHHSAPLHHPSGGRIDLHRFLLAEDASPDTDHLVWKAAQPVEFEKMSVLAPCPEDELLLAILHGWRWNTLPPLRWIADVATILRTTSDLDWDHVIREARRRGMAYRTARALAFAAKYVHDIPATVMAQLQQGPFAWYEIQEERFMNRKPGLIPLTGIQAAYKFFRLHGTPKTPRALFRFTRHIVEAGAALSGPNSPFWPFELLGRRVRFLLRRRT